MRKTSLIAVVLAGAVWAAGQSVADSPAEREAHWREDLQVLLSTLSAKGTAVDFKRGISSRGQKDYDKLYPHLASDLKELDSEIARLSDGQIVLRLMRLIAAPNVAHNSIQMPVGTGFFARLPLEFRWFSDGLAVVAASEEYTAALGAHVRQFGSKAPEEVLTALSPYIPHENEAWLRFVSTGFMRPRILLEQAGVTDANGEVELTLQKPGSAPFTLTVKAGDSRVKRATLQEVLQPPVPLYRSQPGKLYWHRYVEDSATLFIQYSACVNDPKYPFSDFSKMVLADADAHRVKRVVLDLRANGGGDSRIINPLFSGLEQRRNRLGPVYVLIGTNTFSSGADNAEELRRRLHATLAGEPTGGKPSSYGEVKTVTLPNSKVVVRYTSKWFGSHKDSEPEALMPDLRIGYTLEDEFAGRDPVLAATTARE
jgi:hypothetical protein